MDHNVIDKYREWELDLIRNDLDLTRAPFISVFENLQGDFNKATGIRNHNNFNGREIWYVGARKYDRRGTVGTHLYEHVLHFPSWSRVELPRGYVIVAVENNMEGAVALHDYLWNPNSIMIYGEEGRGLSPDALALADDVVYIESLGSVRSLNVGTASGIIMYDYSVKTGRFQ